MPKQSDKAIKTCALFLAPTYPEWAHKSSATHVYGTRQRPTGAAERDTGQNPNGELLRLAPKNTTMSVHADATLRSR